MGFLSKMRGFASEMDPRSFKIVNNKEYNNIYGNYMGLMKSFDNAYLNTNSRPSLPYPYMDTPTGSKIPLWRLSPLRIYEMADYVGDLRVVFETIQREMFRNGVKVKPKFKYKCKVCLKEFKEKPMKKYIPLEDQLKGKVNKDTPEELECDECGNENPKKFRKPDPKNRIILRTLIDKPVNYNRQNIVTVAREYERDLDIIDQGFVIVTRKYKLILLDEPDPLTGARKRVDSSEIDEFIRIHPAMASMVASNEGRLGVNSTSEKAAWICPVYNHRDKLMETPVCTECGTECITAVIEANSVPYGLAVANPKRMYYADTEVIFTAGKFYPDLLYGLSPVMSIWKKVMSLYHQDEYMWKYFDQDRPPKSILALGSRNYETAQAFFERQRMGARMDPYMPRPILLNTDNVSQALQFIDLTPNFKELELSDLRKELRQIIATMYGVQPINYGESGSSGLGNESLQVTLTNRNIKWYQKFLNEAFFKQVADLFEVDDWEIVLVDSEEIDMLREAQIKGQQIDNMSKLFNMAFDIWTDGNGEFLHSQFPNPERMSMMQNSQTPGKTGKMEGDRSTKPKEELATTFEGEPLEQRPSDEGGKASGSPTAGYSQSRKSVKKTKFIIDKTNKGVEVTKEVIE